MKGSSVLKGVIVLLSAVFIIHQIISSVYTPVKTESAVYYTAVDGFKITGVVVRNEILVNSEKKGVMHFVTADGNRVSKNGVIANIYDSEAASITVTEIDNVKSKISDIKDILSYNDIDAANLDLINSRVAEKVDELVLSASTGNFLSVTQSADRLLSAINRRQAALGDTGDFSAQLELLDSELTKLSASLPAPTGKVLAAESGYFVSMTDGYEEVLTCSDLAALTPEFMQNISAKEAKPTTVGKIVSDYEWYIAAQMSINDSLSYKEGQSLKILTSVKSSPQLSVTVKKINISETSGEAVVLFACNEMNSELAAMRSGPMTVVKAEYNGLKVERRALRVVDSQKGVYVLSGMQINFVPVDILYSNESYIICDKKNENGNVLKLYDSVVVKGKNLYDGKIIS